MLPKRSADGKRSIPSAASPYWLLAPVNFHQRAAGLLRLYSSLSNRKPALVTNILLTLHEEQLKLPADAERVPDTVQALLRTVFSSSTGHFDSPQSPSLAQP